jgi:hypothetical protein
MTQERTGGRIEELQGMSLVCHTIGLSTYEDGEGSEDSEVNSVFDGSLVISEVVSVVKVVTGYVVDLSL